MELAKRAVLSACAMLLISACSGSKAEASDPTSLATPTAITGTATASTSPTNASPATTAETTQLPSSTGLVSSVPASARLQTDAGAEAFARHYMASLNAAWSAPDPALIESLALPSCKTCRNFVKTAASLKQRGSRYEGAAGTFKLSVVLPESTKSTKHVEITYEQNPVRILDRDGHSERTEKRRLFVGVLTVVWDDATWRVSELQSVPQ